MVLNCLLFLISQRRRFSSEQRTTDLFIIRDPCLDDRLRHTKVFRKARLAHIFLSVTVDQTTVDGDLIVLQLFFTLNTVCDNDQSFLPYFHECTREHPAVTCGNASLDEFLLYAEVFAREGIRNVESPAAKGIQTDLVVGDHEGLIYFVSIKEAESNLAVA